MARAVPEISSLFVCVFFFVVAFSFLVVLLCVCLCVCVCDDVIGATFSAFLLDSSTSRSTHTW